MADVVLTTEDSKKRPEVAETHDAKLRVLTIEYKADDRNDKVSAELF
jgi:hypothetical protein